MSEKSMIERMCEMSLEELRTLNDERVSETLGGVYPQWFDTKLPSREDKEEVVEYENIIYLKDGSNASYVSVNNLSKSLMERSDWTTGTLAITGTPDIAIPFYNISSITSELDNKEENK